MVGYEFRTTASAAVLAAMRAPPVRKAEMTSTVPLRTRALLRSPLCGTVSATAIAAALLWPGSAAYANCTPVANGAGGPNGQTVTCSNTNNQGSTANPNAGVGYGDASNGPQNNTINISAGASVTGDNTGFALGTGNTVNNTNGGTIATNGGAVTLARGILTVAGTTTLTVNNNGTISGTTIAANGLASAINGGTITLSNNGGNISSMVPNGASQSIAVSGTSITITNNS